MESLAYRFGWDRMCLVVEENGGKTNINPEKYAVKFASMFNEEQLKECIKGMKDSLQYIIKQNKKEEEKERLRIEYARKLENRRRSERQNTLLFIMSLAGGR